MVREMKSQTECKDPLERQASEVLRREAFDYIARGAGEEATMQENLKAFDKWKIRPRVLRNVSSIDMSVSLLRNKQQTPILFAPIGVQRIAHPEGELASARAAAELGAPFVVSSASSYSLEEISHELGTGTGWFQLYCSLEETVTKSLIRRSEASGYSAIVITVDTPVLGARRADDVNQYSPLEEGDGCGNYMTDPAFCSLLEQSPETDREAALKKQIEIIDRPGLDWDELAAIRTYTDLPILLKGILHPEDARRAVSSGMDGIIVSNHGGRQLDHCIASADALPEIAQAVGGRIPVLLDSGIRTGTDVLKALALGADAVLIGRPAIYGLAAGGKEGVKEAIGQILHELEVSMMLSGVTSIQEITSELLMQHPTSFRG